MAKLTSVAESTTQRTLIFGGPKAGKSLLAAKLAEYYKLIWVDLEKGYSTLFQLPKTWQERVELITIPDTRSFPMAIETCLKMVKGPVDVCEKHGKVKCALCIREQLPSTHVDLNSLSTDSVVVFDSLTQLSNSAISFLTKDKPDDYKLNYDDWGNLGKLLDTFLSHLQQAGYNVVVISHETEAETEGKKKTLVPVGGTRNFSRNIAKYFDHVVYAERKNKKHVFSSSSQYATTILTGSRTNVSVENSKNLDNPLIDIFGVPGSSKLAEEPEVTSNVTKEAEQDTPATKQPVTKPTTNKGGAAKDILERMRQSKK